MCAVNLESSTIMDYCCTADLPPGHGRRAAGVPCCLRVLSFVVSSVFLVSLAFAQTTGKEAADHSLGLSSPSGALTCSPAPCVLRPLLLPSNPKYGVSDPAIAANPTNESEILVGTSNGNCPFPSNLGFYHSNNRGLSWTLACMPSAITRTYVFWPFLNPMVAYDHAGTSYIAGDFIRSDGNPVGMVFFAKSSDAGTWTHPGWVLGDDNNYPSSSWFSLDNSSSSPYFGSSYVSSVVFNLSGTQVIVSHSRDGGATWHQAAIDVTQRVPAQDVAGTMAVGKDGTVYVTWTHCMAKGSAAGCANGEASVMLSKSHDGGSTWSLPVIATKCNCSGVILPNAPNAFITDTPVIGVDTSDGPHSGSVYVGMYNWTGTFMQVIVVRSADGGNSWSKPVPVAPAIYTHDQFFPWLSVSNTGQVGVSWLDRRNDPANVSYQAFCAISTDGGSTFVPNIQLTTAFSNPGDSGFGFYTGSTWSGSTYYAAWMDSSGRPSFQAAVGGMRIQ
jgi:hypothetical protein